MSLKYEPALVTTTPRFSFFFGPSEEVKKFERVRMKSKVDRTIFDEPNRDKSLFVSLVACWFRKKVACQLIRKKISYAHKI